MLPLFYLVFPIVISQEITASVVNTIGYSSLKIEQGNKMKKQFEESLLLRKAEEYAKRYRSQMDLVESKSLLSKVRPVTHYDLYALGSMLENYETYQQICERDGNLGNLGRVPDVAFDVISVSKIAA